MDHFSYKDNILHAEDIAITKIAKEVGTPFYCYSHATLKRHYQVFAEAFKGTKTTICFAVKSNSNLAVLKTLEQLGAGADAVSEGEIRRALAVGIPGRKIVFSGVGKTREEMAFALKQKIFQFNIESEPELIALNEVAESLGVIAPIAVRINPDIDAKTHYKISTGKKENKFGIEWTAAREIYNKAKMLKNIDVQGVSTHIGSQLVDLMPFEQAFRRINDLVQILRIDGHHIHVLDLGGGLGIPYDMEEPPSPKHYAEVVLKATRDLNCELILEPGRLITGNAGILVSEVIYCKASESRQFLIIDAGMNDLIRPTLYEAYHEIIPVQKPTAPAKSWKKIDIVGPVCESGDVFALQRAMPPLTPGDLVAVRTAGAYGAVMASNYNTRPLVPEVMVHGSEYAVVRKRQTYEELLAMDSVPAWLNK